MKVILKEYIRKVGDVGDIVEVKSGYAGNYLLPQGLAIPAVAENLKRIENIRGEHLNKHKHLIGDMKEMSEKLNGKSVTITARVNEAGRLYGSVSEREIAAAINNAHGTAVEPEHVEISGHFKEPGVYSVHMRFTVGIGADMEVVVAAEGAEGAEGAPAEVKTEEVAEKATEETPKPAEETTTEPAEEDKGKSESGEEAEKTPVEPF